MKRYRQLPDRAVYKDGNTSYGRLGNIQIRSQAVVMSQHLPYDEKAPEYSDADLELLIAQLKVAKEALVADVDKHIAILTDVLSQREAA